MNRTGWTLLAVGGVVVGAVVGFDLLTGLGKEALQVLGPGGGELLQEAVAVEDEDGSTSDCERHRHGLIVDWTTQGVDDFVVARVLGQSCHHSVPRGFASAEKAWHVPTEGNLDKLGSVCRLRDALASLRDGAKSILTHGENQASPKDLGRLLQKLLDQLALDLGSS